MLNGLANNSKDKTEKKENFNGIDSKLSVTEEVSMTVETNSRLSNISIDNLSGPGNVTSKLDYGNYSTCLESRGIDQFLQNKRANAKHDDMTAITNSSNNVVTKPDIIEKTKQKIGTVVNEKLPVGNSTIYFFKQFK